LREQRQQRHLRSPKPRLYRGREQEQRVNGTTQVRAQADKHGGRLRREKALAGSRVNGPRGGSDGDSSSSSGSGSGSGSGSSGGIDTRPAKAFEVQAPVPTPSR
jgi:hypothetical protein